MLNLVKLAALPPGERLSLWRVFEDNARLAVGSAHWSPTCHWNLTDAGGLLA